MDNSKFIKIQAIKIKQLHSGIVFIGKISFPDLNDIHKLTERKESYFDPIEEKNYQYKSDSEFQRQLSENKLNEIKSYLEFEYQNVASGKSLVMFPSSIILSLNTIDVEELDLTPAEKYEYEKGNHLLSEERIIKSYKPDMKGCFYQPINDETDLYDLIIPRTANICLIVDGQHRFAGTKLFVDSISDGAKKLSLNKFEFITTFLIGFDLFEVGRVFATVNFNQKPVNRSLYYDIFGSAPQTDRYGSIQNDIKLAHDLALHLQNNSNSPINGMIKLLGKGYGLFSQAFFVEKMILIFKSGIWENYINDYNNGGTEYKKIASFMKIYLESIKEAYYDCWPRRVERDHRDVYSSYDYKFILCKTTGLGAFLRLVKDVYPIYKVLEDSHLKISLVKFFNQIDANEAQKIFSKDGVYGGTGSEGMQRKLYMELRTKYKLLT